MKRVRSTEQRTALGGRWQVLMNGFRSFGMLGMAAWLTLGSAAWAQPAEVGVDINVVPIASITFEGGNLLALTVPPSGSTVNTVGSVIFVVTGNAKATLTAAPNDFVFIPGTNNGWMGKAIKGGDVIGYQVQLTFPNNTVGSSFKAIASMPLSVQQGTVPPLSVPLPLTGGERKGTVDLLASATWTTDGGLPATGVYSGQVVLTVTAENL